MNNIKGFFNLLSYFDLLSLELIIILKLFVLKFLLMDGIKFLNYCPFLLKIFAIFLSKILLWITSKCSKNLKFGKYFILCFKKLILTCSNCFPINSKFDNMTFLKNRLVLDEKGPLIGLHYRVELQKIITSTQTYNF